jgi:tetratricopeptide (TPR) repeat protein
MGRLPEAENAFRQAIDIFDSLSSLPGRDDRWQRAGVEFELGELLRRSGRREAAEKAYRRAIADAERNVSQYPHVPMYRYAMVKYLGTLAAFLRGAGREDEAAPFRRSAHDLCEKLEEEFEEASDRLDHLGAVGAILRRAGDSEAAERLVRRAVALAGKLSDQYTEEPSGRQSRAWTHLHLALVLQQRGRLRDAAEELRTALSIFEPLATELPDDSSYRREEASTLNFMGRALRSLPGETANAVQCHQRAIELCQRLVAEVPDQPLYRRELVRSHFALGISLRLAGRLAEAIQALERAQEAYRPYADTTDDPENLEQFASVHNELAWILATCPDMKHRDPGRAVSLARKAVELAPENGNSGIRSAWPSTERNTGPRHEPRCSSPCNSEGVATPSIGSSWPWLTGNWVTGSRPASGTTRPCSGWTRRSRKTTSSTASGARRKR